VVIGGIVFGCLCFCFVCLLPCSFISQVVTEQLGPVHTGDSRKSTQSTKPKVNKVVTLSPICSHFVESRLSPAHSNSTVCRERHCRQRWTCSTRSTLLKVGDFYRPNVQHLFDFVASVYWAEATCSTFDKVDGVKFDFVNSVCRPLQLL